MNAKLQLAIVDHEPISDEPVSDRLLIDAWIGNRDADAFAVLLDRYACLVMSQLVSRTLELAISQASGNTAGPLPASTLDSLLLSETSKMFTPTLVGAAGIVTLGLAGLLVAQVDGPFEGPASPAANVVQVGVGAPPQSSAEVKTKITGNAAKSPTGDPLDAPQTADVKANSPGWSSDYADAYKKIEDTLSERVDLDFVEMPLVKAVGELSRILDIPIIIDTIALAERDGSRDYPVDLQVTGISAESALRLILQDLGLTYTIDDEVLQVTSVGADEGQHQLVRVYWSQDTGLDASEQGMLLIQSMVNTSCWELVGGASSISVIQGGSGSQSQSGFVVNTTYQTHRKIATFLKTIRDGAGGKVTAQVQGNAIGSEFFEEGQPSKSSLAPARSPLPSETIAR